MFGYGPTDLRRVTPVRKSSDNLSVFVEEERHQETSPSSSESFRFNPEGSAFRRPNRTGYPLGSSSSGSSGTSNTNSGRPVYGAFEHHVPFPTPLSKGEQQRCNSELDDSPFGHDTPFSPDPSIIGNYEHITESPNNFFHEGSFRHGQQGPPSPDIMGLVTQLVHSQMPPDRFVNEFGKDSGNESMGLGSVSTSLDFESSHNHNSYESLYSNDNNRQQQSSSSALSSQQLQMGYNRYNGGESVVRSSTGSLSVSTSTGSWVSPQPSPLGQQHPQQLQQHLGGPWVHDKNGGGSMEGGGGMGCSQFPSQSRPPPSLYPAPPPLMPSRPYPNGYNALGTGG